MQRCFLLSSLLTHRHRIDLYGYSNAPFGKRPRILGKGSTGRTAAKNIEEQIAMKSVLSDSLKGAKQIISSSKMTGKRWPGKSGWIKMQRTFKIKGSKTITIHFNYNKVTKKFDDFKFK